jgi:uncharacterized protein (DUF697 family)
MANAPDPAAEADAATEEVARHIRGASIAAAVLGVVLSPIPLADEIVLLPVFGVLTAKIARTRGVGVRAVPWRPIAVTAVAGLGARAAVNVTVSYIPVVAAAANAASGVLLTRLLGRYVDTACRTAQSGGETAPMSLKDIADAIRPKPRAAT